MQQLEFTDFYKTLKFTDNGQVQNFDLSQAGKAVQVGWQNGGYQIEVVDRPEDNKLALDILKKPRLKFEGAKLGGTVIIDLRDIERLGSPSGIVPGSVSVELQLEGFELNLWYTSGGGKAFKMGFQLESLSIEQPGE